MPDDPTFFQYCAKQIVFSSDRKAVLMAQRTGEADYDGVFALIGGKTETTDGGLLEGLQREKNEEIGESARIKICWTMSCYQAWYRKKNGAFMVLPHHVAIFVSGEIKLNPKEYSNYKWVPVAEIDQYDQIPTNPHAVRAALRLLPILTDDDFIEI